MKEYDEYKENSIISVINFCEKYNIKKYLDSCICEIKRNFSNLKKININVQNNPELEKDNEYIMIDVYFYAEQIDNDYISEKHKEYQRFNECIIEKISWPKRDLILLNLILE